MALTLTAGYTWTSGEVDTATKRNSAAVPTVADGQTYAFGLGSAASPSQTFNGDTNTGAYSPGADQWAVAVAGVQVVAVSSTGLSVVGNIVPTGSPSFVPGSVYLNAVNGLTIAAKTGSTNDLLLTSNSGSDLLTNPTGTNRLVTGGALTVNGQLTQYSATLAKTGTSLTDAAQSQVATITNAPVGKAGNPTKWVPVDDNGTTRYVPLW